MSRIYAATNAGTGEVITGTVLELMKALDVCKGTINAYRENGRLLNGTWRINEVEPEGEICNTIPKCMLQEWDEVTADLRAKMAMLKAER